MTGIAIRPLEQSDHADWRRLWTAYLEFYKATVPEEVYDTTWKRLFTPGQFEPRGFIALDGGKAVGLTHYLYHRSCWSIASSRSTAMRARSASRTSRSTSRTSRATFPASR